MADLSFKWKLPIVVIIFICFIVFFKSKMLDFVSARAEHLTITIGDIGISKKDFTFHDDKIVTILIPPPEDHGQTAKEQKRSCLDIVNKEDIRNEESENEKKWSETWRKNYAKLITELSDVGARVIVFDIGFDTDRGKTDILMTEAIRQAKKRGTSVIIPFGYLDKSYNPLIADNFRTAVGDGYGLACGEERFGDIIKTPLAVGGNHLQLLYSISLKSVEAYFAGKIDSVDFKSYRIGMRPNNTITQKSDIYRFFDYQIGNINGVIKKARLFIDVAPKDKLNIISYDDKVNEILKKDGIDNKKNLDEILKNDDRSKLQDIFNSRIVLIGAASEKDKHSVPGDKRYGVLIQADAINTLFKDIEDNRSIQSLPEMLEYVFIALFAICGTVLSSYIAWRQTGTHYSRLLLAISIIFLPMIYCFFFSWYLYTRERILVNWVYYFLAFLSVVSIEWILRSISKRRYHVQES